MKELITRTKNFLRSEDGPTATEYAVMLALIIVACLAAITTLSDKVQTTFTNVASALPDGSTAAGTGT
jgi:pilus assembly protein Flp/PilA